MQGENPVVICGTKKGKDWSPELCQSSTTLQEGRCKETSPQLLSQRADWWERSGTWTFKVGGASLCAHLPSEWHYYLTYVDKQVPSRCLGTSGKELQNCHKVLITCLTPLVWLALE